MLDGARKHASRPFWIIAGVEQPVDPSPVFGPRIRLGRGLGVRTMPKFRDISTFAELRRRVGN